MEQLEFHVITDGKQSDDRILAVASTLVPYVTAIHIRENSQSAGSIYNLSEKLKQRGVKSEAIYMNDRVDVAAAAGLGGVHLKESSLAPDVVRKHFPPLRIGRSVHSSEGAIHAEQKGADYLFFGHVFSTKSKKDKEPKGLHQLRDVAKAVSVPVFAIGGISPEKVSSVLCAGASGIAVMSGIWNADDPVSIAKQYKTALMKGSDQDAQTL
ncbi:thiamine phosphate synthase [Fictibacillus fluitans]|uniref:Thiamine phosphate synthase n=1 Tax=Fictibacillus fluitans TaxID=3058422 RepID=A0ABT8HUC4_9BACL|nr:thiamine phosphate synthase [Fictibacillus sp. NE201]MDN4524369.1 thiamine phosphate synthase [Fictibacillus sp. NE201]